MRVLALEHQADCDAGYIGAALERRGAQLERVRLDLGETLPELSSYDLLLVLGGAMNVYAGEAHPWLEPETRAIAAAVAADKAVLGICLGGQLLAKALGARVHLGGAPEVGLIDIALTDAGRADPLFAGLPRLEAIAWHDDTFDLPAGAVALAGSLGCANQAFRFGPRAYGLQFHPEVTPALLAAWVREAGAGMDGEKLQGKFAAENERLRAQADRLVANLMDGLR